MGFTKETELCQAFLDSLPDVWRKYPEQGDWDFIIQRGLTQIGVQAKLVADLKVLTQALPSCPGEPKIGPHYRAVLIGRWSGRTVKAALRSRSEFCALARHLRLLVLRPPDLWRNAAVRPLGWKRFDRWLPVDRMINYTQMLKRPPWEKLKWRYYRWHPSSPIWVPPFEPKLPAGVPSPSHVSAWQLAALALHRICEDKGWICLNDARKIVGSMAGVSFQASSLLKYFWYATQVAAEGRQKRWKSLKNRNTHLKTPAEKWPDLWKKVSSGAYDGQNS